MRGFRRSTGTSVRRSVTVAGTRVHYQETATDGPSLVLIHGLSGSTRWWSRNLPALSERFHVYAIDLPGFGDNRRWGRFMLADAPARLGEWFDAVGIDRASIVGHSMGGVIATDFALRFPDRLERLILVDAPVVPDPRGWLRFGMSSLMSARHLPLGFVPLLMTDALRAGPFTISRAGRAVRSTDFQAKLNTITIPILVIWGEHDGMFPPSYGQRVAAALPGATFTMIPGAGHNSMWDRPDAFNRLVLDVLT